MVKNNNEITIKVNDKNDVLIKKLETKGFVRGVKFLLDDYYFCPSSLDIKNLTPREILSNCLIVRAIVGDKDEKMIIKKNKVFNENGDIVKQDEIICRIEDINEARKLLKVLGYKELMNLKEDDIIYSLKGLELLIKNVMDKYILIEAETNDQYDIDELKIEIEKLGLNYEKNYFVKKAEIELKEIINN